MVTIKLMTQNICFLEQGLHEQGLQDDFSGEAWEVWGLPWLPNDLPGVIEEIVKVELPAAPMVGARGGTL